MAVDLIPLPPRPDLDGPTSDDTKELKKSMDALFKDYNKAYGIIKQDVSRLSLPPSRPAAPVEPPIGHGLGRSDLTDLPINLTTSSFRNGLQLANGADRGKVTITFKYLGIGPVIIGSGTNVTYTADLAVAGANGLDTGAEAGNTWYYLYMIVGENTGEVYDPATVLQPPMHRTGAKVASLLSVSATPTLPPGFTRYRNVGMVRNNGSSDLYRFTHAADDTMAWWNEDVSTGDFLVLTSTNTAASYTDVDCSAVAPPTSREIVFRASGTTTFHLKNKDHANVVYSQLLGAVGQQVVGCNSSQAVQYRTHAAGGAVDLFVLGYRFIP